ncbi:MAG: hypothetical protein RBR77_07470, partial [Thauera sp.]|nr:hypothetical protein [Thauera sp.]
MTITDFTQGETIKFVSHANANFASSKVSLIAEATFDNYVTEAAICGKRRSDGCYTVHRTTMGKRLRGFVTDLKSWLMTNRHIPVS